MQTKLDTHFYYWFKDKQYPFDEGLAQAKYSYDIGLITVEELLEVHSKQAFRAGVHLGINSVRATIDTQVDKFNLSL